MEECQISNENPFGASPGSCSALSCGETISAGCSSVAQRRVNPKLVFLNGVEIGLFLLTMAVASSLWRTRRMGGNSEMHVAIVEKRYNRDISCN